LARCATRLLCAVRSVNTLCPGTCSLPYRHATEAFTYVCALALRHRQERAHLVDRPSSHSQTIKPTNDSLIVHLRLLVSSIYCGLSQLLLLRLRSCLLSHLFAQTYNHPHTTSQRRSPDLSCCPQTNSLPFQIHNSQHPFKLPTMSNAPTLINLPPPPSDPVTPSDMP
jgi:hypothetical protein